MRWSWLRALILGFLIGPAPVPAAASEEETAGAEEAGPVRRSGHVARGLHFHVWGEDAREAADWGVELRQASREAGDPARWRTIAATSAVLPPLLTDETEAELPFWSDAPVGDSRISPLGCLLCLLPRLDRTCLISSWATSANAGTRRALAQALSAPFEAVGIRGALEHLLGDPDAEVRRLARSAAASRRAPLG